MRSTRGGFTLIELLIVLAIFAILAAILFPVFARAREKARQTACLSNQKQIGMSVGLYLQDYDERLFLYATRKETSKDISNSHTGIILTKEADVARSRWWNVISPYLTNRQVFVCPSDDLPTPSEDVNDNRTILRSYIANRATEGLAFSQIPYSADAMVFTEKWGHFYGDINKPTTDFWVEAPYGAFWYIPGIDQMYIVANRHNGGVISVFFDGHARWLLPHTITDSVTLTGCDLIHAYPIVPHGLCDQTIDKCSNNQSINICNKFYH